MRLRDLADDARTRLVAAGIAAPEAALDAELLLRHVLGWDRATWLTRRDEPGDAAVSAAVAAVVRRRAAREPLAYIRGVQEFYGRPFAVGPGVLIPRPETEQVVEEALALLPAGHPPRVADIGTGSGCLAVTLALEAPAASVTATDISAAALVVARQNAREHGVAARIEFVETPFLPTALAPLDLIVANPPYVAEADESSLAPEVASHEPRVALFGGTDGLRDVAAIVTLAVTALAPGGWLVMEIGAGQWPAVRKMLAEARLDGEARVRHDLQGIPRVVVARR